MPFFVIKSYHLLSLLCKVYALHALPARNKTLLSSTKQYLYFKQREQLFSINRTFFRAPHTPKKASSSHKIYDFVCFFAPLFFSNGRAEKIEDKEGTNRKAITSSVNLQRLCLTIFCLFLENFFSTTRFVAPFFD